MPQKYRSLDRDDPIRSRLDEKLHDLNRTRQQVEEERQIYVDLQDKLTNAEEAQQLIQTVAVAVQDDAHQRISSVVSRCLETIFDDPYEFSIVFERKRGKTEAALTFTRGNLTLSDPLFEAGGGVIDVAAFALRLACLVLERPIKRRLLVLDEPFTKIRGIQNRQRMRMLLEQLSEEFQVQIILCIDVDAYPDFAVGNVVEIHA